MPPEDAASLQMRLRELVLAYDRLPSPVRLVGGVDVAYDDTSGRAFSAVVVMDVQTLRRIETAVAQAPAGRSHNPRSGAPASCR